MFDVVLFDEIYTTFHPPISPESLLMSPGASRIAEGIPPKILSGYSSWNSPSDSSDNICQALFRNSTWVSLVTFDGIPSCKDSYLHSCRNCFWDSSRNSSSSFSREFSNDCLMNYPRLFPWITPVIFLKIPTESRLVIATIISPGIPADSPPGISSENSSSMLPGFPKGITLGIYRMIPEGIF